MCTFNCIPVFRQNGRALTVFLIIKIIVSDLFWNSIQPVCYLLKDIKGLHFFKNELVIEKFLLKLNEN